MQNNIIKNAALHATLTTLYIILISSFFFFAPHIFGDGKTILAPIIMLSLLVFSAAVTGSLVFGRPALWYLDGRKKEAVLLLAWTLGIFLGFTMIALLSLYLSASL